MTSTSTSASTTVIASTSVPTPEPVPAQSLISVSMSIDALVHACKYAHAYKHVSACINTYTSAHVFVLCNGCVFYLCLMLHSMFCVFIFLLSTYCVLCVVVCYVLYVFVSCVLCVMCVVWFMVNGVDHQMSYKYSNCILYQLIVL